MIKIFSFLFISVFISGYSAYAQDTGPVASLAESTFDFGLVLRGAIAELTVPITNKGNADLNFVDAKTSLPTLQIRMPKTVAPGSEGKIELKLDTAIYSNDIDGDVVIVTNDPKTPNISLKIKGKVESKVVLEPEPPVFLQGFRWEAEKKAAIVSIQSRDGKPLSKVDLETEGENFVATLSPIDNAKRYELTVKMNPKGVSARAVGSATLVVNQERIAFSVFTFLKDKVYFSPSDLYFAPVNLEQLEKNPNLLNFRKQSIFLYQYQGTDFRIEVSKPEYISMEKLPAEGPSAAVVDIPNQGKTAVFELIFSLVKERLKKGSYNDTITITTNDPEFPVLKIPVSLDVS